MENQKILIDYNGKKEEIIQYITESDERFNQRLEYIKKAEKGGENWKEALRLSKVWFNIKFNKCQYNIETFKKAMIYN